MINCNILSIPNEIDNIVIAAKYWVNSNSNSQNDPIIIFVHQWGLLGGSGALMEGLARNMASLNYNSITFDLRGVGKSSGKSSWTNFTEVSDLKTVIDYVIKTYDKKILLVGSSAGAPIIGYTLDYSPQIIGGTFIGMVWGFWVSMVFSWSYENIEKSIKPKLFIIGDKDEFTSIAQYNDRITKIKGVLNDIKLIQGKNHFEIESPYYDKTISKWIVEFIEKLNNM
jgi:alpha/beta superfamily hydrolase